MAELRVLVVEDDAAAQGLLVAILENDGYRICAVGDGRAALDAVDDFRPHLALIDCHLPGIDGSEVARRLRQTSDLPIIFVTAADAAEDVHGAFRMGADDYIVKPFDPEELSWRVRAVLRRSGRAVAQVWECGDLVVNELAQSVTRAGEPIALTATEFKLVAVLVRNRTRVVPRRQLLAQVWGYDADDHVLEVHMSSLRRKIDALGARMIHTIRATGYVMRPSER
ncbi:MAG TPA: response regulator transcription factor [Acidimicrobiales bacterium]|nr:response regulator transcription factor [Acidimicrobiales bacterium]